MVISRLEARLQKVFCHINRVLLSEVLQAISTVFLLELNRGSSRANLQRSFRQILRHFKADFAAAKKGLCKNFPKAIFWRLAK